MSWVSQWHRADIKDSQATATHKRLIRAGEEEERTRDAPSSHLDFTYIHVQRFGIYTKKKKKLILYFSNDELSWLKVTVYLMCIV